MFDVDFVFPYVNPLDPDWQKSFKYCSGTAFNQKNVRFRDFSLLKYIFRSIESYAGWINRVVMIVSSDTQIPSFLKPSSSLIFVKHKDYIPLEYLPTFNSNTIEMFLPFIPNLSEHFLYSNDDLLFINKTKKDDYFLGEKGIAQFYTFRKATDPKGFQLSVKRSWDVVESYFGFKINLNQPYHYLKQFHGSAAPRLLSLCKECFSNLEKPVKNSLTMFRNTDTNLTQYIYSYYSLYKNFVNIMPTRQAGEYVSGEAGKEKILDAIRNSPSKMLCINDTAAMTSEIIAAIYEELEKKFPKKSKFEV